MAQFKSLPTSVVGAREYEKSGSEKKKKTGGLSHPGRTGIKVMEIEVMHGGEGERDVPVIRSRKGEEKCGLNQ